MVSVSLEGKQIVVHSIFTGRFEKGTNSFLGLDTVGFGIAEVEEWFGENCCKEWKRDAVQGDFLAHGVPDRCGFSRT